MIPCQVSLNWEHYLLALAVTQGLKLGGSNVQKPIIRLYMGLVLYTLRDKLRNNNSNFIIVHRVFYYFKWFKT